MAVRTWTPPPGEYYKINIDAQFNIHTKKGGWGAIRKNNEAICFAVAGPIESTDSFQAETVALANAIQLADQMGVG